MLALYVSVPIACWRRGHAREFLETEPLPPPSTCYGFLLSFVGEQDRRCHERVRVTAGIIGDPSMSVVLRTTWRVKDKKQALGVGTNRVPDRQQLWTNSELVVWCDSGQEERALTLEDRVSHALAEPGSVTRFGGLSLGESTHLVNDIRRATSDDLTRTPTAFLLDPDGDVTLPTWVDHVGSAGTRYATGRMVPAAETPDAARVPVIASS